MIKLKKILNKEAKYYGYGEEAFTIIKSDLEKFSYEEINKYLQIIERYNFKERKETDSPHPNTIKDHLKRKKSDNETPIGLARATLRVLDAFYNARTQNNTRNSLVEIIRDTFLNQN